jgi:hypothetical protein
MRVVIPFVKFSIFCFFRRQKCNGVQDDELVSVRMSIGIHRKMVQLMFSHTDIFIGTQRFCLHFAKWVDDE